MNLNLYLCSQEVNIDYDTYDSFIGAFENENEARNCHPSDNNKPTSIMFATHCWCKSPDQVTVKLIGKAKKGIDKGVILASFNAG